ncbi:glycoside hydrolase [Enterococcus sp. JM4C]|uniref:glycoside hydrolase family 2 TIM barrel-domain containing protein n=1 Tax=Candidatus Enterococcus huntleyi TaxID=1857217 RepID=UPI00137940F3|nr:glycoside hydrolase family 2 TIM barrel-domain containing protein [Enterococcus sp. JM4C]KAF1299329.1 glycoside hydrolase [Enterococcus sp. JM4C]
MRKTKLLNHQWDFYYGALSTPPLTAKKAHALGGLTNPLPDEKGERVITSAGGDHFLKLIARGNREQGLENLAGTDLETTLTSDWGKVDLPHDWKIGLPYVNEPANLMSGSKPDGVGFYRKLFSLDEEAYKEQRVILHFDGVMRMADVWLNGAYLGRNNSGYTSFSFDISECARYGSEGDNALLVKVDTTTGPEGWWYEGAGIYKNVWLELIPEIALDRDSLYVATTDLTPEKAELNVSFAINNESAREITIQPRIQLGEQSLTMSEMILKAGQTKNITHDVSIVNPVCWSPENPKLYQVTVDIGTDNLTQTFGIRTFGYDQKGFYLNGAPYELRGVCEHQDFAGVGVALNQDIVEYKLTILKEMGVNAIRSAHHFASEELLMACDRLGILMMNENRLLESTPWRLDDLKKMVKKARHHASLAFWSVANEEVIGNTALGSRIAKKLVQTIKRLDQEHLVISAELLNPEGIVDPEYLDHYDVLGVNYPEAGVMGPGAALIKQQYPDLPMISTENASYFSTRGVYRDDENQCHCNNLGSLYSMVLPGKRQPDDPGAGGTAKPEEVMTYLEEHSYMGGVFLWTGFDYFGEPSPFAWPAISSQFGIVDTCGFEKDYYYYYRAFWTETPFVHMMPHWNREGLEIDDKGEVAVRVFSNVDSVELFVNQQSFGRQTVTGHKTDWRVPYSEGEVRVVGYLGDQQVASTSHQTSGKTAAVEVVERYRGQTHCLFEVRALDKDHTYVPTANEWISLKSNGGDIIGLGNGNPSDHHQNDLTKIRLFNGKALAIVKTQHDEFKLMASLVSE